LVQVTGQTTIQGEAAHVVVLTLARNRESVVWVSAETGQVLQIETMLGETTLLRQVRVRP
jgi:outer membrane lipoprotein-sorting protein